MNLSTRILISLGLGLAAGVGFSLVQDPFFPSLPTWIEPIGTLWVNAIRMTVIPLLMGLLVTAIAGQDSADIAASLGGKTLTLFVLMIIATSSYTLIFAPPLIALLNIDADASRALLASTDVAVATATDLPPFRDWLVNLIPANPFRAAADGSILPLMIFTALFATALLYISESHRTLIVKFFAAIKDAMFVLIGWIMALAPIGIFALVFPLAATLGVAAITALGSFIVIACGLIVGMTLLLYPLATVVGRLPLLQFARTVAPVQVIGFSTRSSLATLPATIAATEKLGISSKTSGVVLPVAVTLFKFASPVGRIAGTYFIASLYGIELGFPAMVVIALAIGLFSFYSPGIPSGGLLIMAPVYTSLGLPVAGIGILIAIDLIVDMFITAANVTANVTATAILSRGDRRHSVP
ncbi:MAG: dicarboxylate/amino acid:cation symporter [Proteobacteria bacterium]|nr:dicarboxylate/amino acid:cation symporter [Pseudomonadota bacterium]